MTTLQAIQNNLKSGKSVCLTATGQIIYHMKNEAFYCAGSLQRIRDILSKDSMPCRSIEIITLQQGPLTGNIMIMDEEGRLKQNMILNVLASEILQDQVLGNVVLSPGEDVE